MAALTSWRSSLATGAHLIPHDVARAFHSLGTRVSPGAVAAIAVAAVAFLALAIANAGGGSERKLRSALRPYEIGARSASAEPEGDGATTSFAGSLLRRFQGTLSDFAEDRGFREGLARHLERAGLRISVGEFLALCIGLAGALGLVGAIVAKLTGAVIGIAFAALVPAGALQYLTDRRTRRFAAQIPDVLKILAASIRAGFSLLQGLDVITKQVAEPMATELRRAFAATRLGASAEEALDGVADRVGSRDFTWAATAIRIQRTVGGNLAEILDTVANTMTERERLRSEVRSLTAEGRISAVIVGVLPLGLAAFMYVIDRSYVMTLVSTFGGEVALAAGALLEITGVIWLRRVVRVEA